jgi:hypothetical protein
MIPIKSIFEEIADELFKQTNHRQAVKDILFYINGKNINVKDKTLIIYNVEQSQTLYKLQKYVCNSLLKYEGHSLLKVR